LLQTVYFSTSPHKPNESESFAFGGISEIHQGKLQTKTNVG